LSITDETFYEVTIFPNPTSDFITIEQSNTFIQVPTVVKIYDITGRELMHKTVDWSESSDNFSIDISHLPKGSYQVVLLTRPYKQTTRLVKI